MISSWKIKNFKSIRSEINLDLGPLTIFAGPNSSGKSTLVQSMLLIAQTLNRKATSRAVVLNGVYTNLGQFNDIKSIGGSNDITIEFTCVPRRLNDNIQPSIRSVSDPIFGKIDFLRSRFLFDQVCCQIIFDAGLDERKKDLYQLQPRLNSMSLSNTYQGTKDDVQCYKISIFCNDENVENGSANCINPTDQELVDSLRYRVNRASTDDESLKELKNDFSTAEISGCSFWHFFPDKITISVDSAEIKSKNIATALLGSRRYPTTSMSYFTAIPVDEIIPSGTIYFLEDLLDHEVNISEFLGDVSERDKLTLEKWRDNVRKLDLKSRMNISKILRANVHDLFQSAYNSIKDNEETIGDKRELIQVNIPTEIWNCRQYLDKYFNSSFRYLGPLRTDPKPLYPVTPVADPHDIGLQGENTAAILDLHKRKKISYIPSKNFIDWEVDNTLGNVPLEDAVVDWLKYLGVAESVESKDRGKLGHELKVNLSGIKENHDLTHVGVGVSQVLPILVTCLLSEPDSTMVFEQPELHLHPKVQTLLGDFFLSMIMCGKQCIVETHSEYFIDRLRFRIAASKIGKFVDDVSIYFVEKESGDSKFRRVVINEYGAIGNWPEGFFDQSQEQAENILRAAMIKRRKSRGASDG
ncbi:MAG: DUF3696 domain-containing protein [Gammaproteobacteria bacterium]|nr:DUF3696 domain-containing protein [Gammaproteobacteria bacterium]